LSYSLKTLKKKKMKLVASKNKYDHISELKDTTCSHCNGKGSKTSTFEPTPRIIKCPWCLGSGMETSVLVDWRINTRKQTRL